MINLSMEKEDNIKLIYFSNDELVNGRNKRQYKTNAFRNVDHLINCKKLMYNTTKN